MRPRLTSLRSCDMHRSPSVLAQSLHGYHWRGSHTRAEVSEPCASFVRMPHHCSGVMSLCCARSCRVTVTSCMHTGPSRHQRVSSLRQESPGKEDGCSLKPFGAVQRVQLPPGKGAARRPEASLARVTATPLVKRRQQVPKPGVEPRHHVRAGAFGVLGPGAASTGLQMARSCRSGRGLRAGQRYGRERQET